MSEWQPIKTAPKWWTPIILFDPESEPSVFEGYFNGEDINTTGEWRESRNSGVTFNPTMWMPLPSPPISEEGE